MGDPGLEPRTAARSRVSAASQQPGETVIRGDAELPASLDSPGHRACPPTLATVLFTDIVGSTERLAALGDAGWRDLVREHHAVVRRQLSRFRGREVDTAGDGFFATFDGPARGIRCASAISNAVRELEDRGTHELKGIPGDWRLFAVTA
jgi:class 3 adenylate cyclase